MKTIKTAAWLPMNHDYFIGTQPIRVLQELITRQFENTSEGFLSLSNMVIDKFGLHPGIVYHINELPILEMVDGHIQTPFVDSKKRIHIHETFLSYVWCVSYAVLSFYNYGARRISKEISETELKESAVFNNIFDYGVSLIAMFSSWDKELPNPEKFDASIAENVTLANHCFLIAMNFILCHEFAHIELDHRLRFSRLMLSSSAISFNEGDFFVSIVGTVFKYTTSGSTVNETFLESYQ